MEHAKSYKPTEDAENIMKRARCSVFVREDLERVLSAIVSREVGLRLPKIEKMKVKS